MPWSGSTFWMAKNCLTSSMLVSVYRLIFRSKLDKAERSVMLSFCIFLVGLRWSWFFVCLKNDNTIKERREGGGVLAPWRRSWAQFLTPPHPIQKIEIIKAKKKRTILPTDVLSWGGILGYEVWPSDWDRNFRVRGVTFRLRFFFPLVRLNKAKRRLFNTCYSKNGSSEISVSFLTKLFLLCDVL